MLDQQQKTVSSDSVAATTKTTATTNSTTQFASDSGQSSVQLEKSSAGVEPLLPPVPRPEVIEPASEAAVTVPVASKDFSASVDGSGVQGEPNVDEQSSDDSSYDPSSTTTTANTATTIPVGKMEDSKPVNDSKPFDDSKPEAVLSENSAVAVESVKQASELSKSDGHKDDGNANTYKSDDSSSSSSDDDDDSTDGRREEADSIDESHRGSSKTVLIRTTAGADNLAANVGDMAHRVSSKDDDSSSSSSSDDDDDSEDEDMAESHINMREKLRSATAKIEKIPPTIEDLEAGEQLDLANLQKLILKDKRSDLLLGESSRKGFEDDEEDDELDYEEEQLNRMMRERFNRQNVKGRGSPSGYIFDNDDDEMQGFEDLEEDLEDQGAESLLREQLFRQASFMQDDDDMEGGDENEIWNSKGFNGGAQDDDSDDDDDDLLGIQMKNKINQAIKNESNKLDHILRAGGGGPGARSSIYGFQSSRANVIRHQKSLPKPTKDNLEDISEILRTNIVPHKKMQVVTALKERGFAYVAELFEIFSELEVKRLEESKEDEKKKDTESLNAVRQSKFALLTKQMLLLSDIQLVEGLMSDRFYMNVFGALQLLPEFKDRLDCRDFFEKARFKEVVPIDNDRLLSKIHTYYRVNFLKETIFPNQEGQIQQTLACICINNMIELLKEMLSNVDYLRRIVKHAITATEVQSQNDAIQFFVEIVQQFKAYQQYLQGHAQFSKSIHEVLLRQLQTLKLVKTFFQRDQRVMRAYAEDVGSPQAADASSASEESKIQDFSTLHDRFSDKGCFDVILTQLVELINMLLQTNNRELITEFLKDPELAKVLGLHVFYAPEEALRSQIVELFKTILDMSGAKAIQIEVEKLIIDALMKPFFSKLQRCQSKSVECEGEGQINQITIEKTFKNQSQLLFELTQLMLKPLINALMQDQRKDVTAVVVNFLTECDMTQLSLGVFANEENDLLTRLMGLKFFKSLFTLCNQSPEVTKLIVSAQPISYCVATLRKFEHHPTKQLNMLESAMFEMINSFGGLLFDKVGHEMHAKVVTQYVEMFPNQRRYLDKFILPDALKKYRKAQELKRQNEENFQASPKFREFLQRNRTAQGSMIANRIAARELAKKKAAQRQIARDVSSAVKVIRFKDLVLRDFADERELEQVQALIGQKRARESTSKEKEDIFSSANKRKRTQMSAFKFSSKQGEKLPVQPNEGLGSSPTWSDSDEDCDDSRNEESKTDGLVSFYINGPGVVSDGRTSGNQGFVRASTLQLQDQKQNKRQESDQTESSCLLELQQRDLYDEVMPQSQEEQLLDASYLLGGVGSSSQDATICSDMATIGSDIGGDAIGSGKEHLEIELPLMDGQQELPTLGSHLTSLNSSMVSGGHDSGTQQQSRAAAQQFKGGDNSLRESDSLRSKFEKCQITLFPHETQVLEVPLPASAPDQQPLASEDHYQMENNKICFGRTND